MQTIPVAVVSKVHVFGLLIAGIAVSSPAEGMDVLLFVIVCCVGSGLSASWSPVPRSSIVRDRVLCLIVLDPETSRTLRPTAELECSATEELKEYAMLAAQYGET